MRTIIKVNIQTYQITYKSESLIYKSESIAIRRGDYLSRNIIHIKLQMGILECRSEHSKARSTGRRTQECDVRIRTGTGMGTGTIL